MIGFVLRYTVYTLRSIPTVVNRGKNIKEKTNFSKGNKHFPSVHLPFVLPTVRDEPCELYYATTGVKIVFLRIDKKPTDSFLSLLHCLVPVFHFYTYVRQYNPPKILKFYSKVLC